MMHNYSEYLNAISARADDLKQKITSAQAERAIILTAVYRFSDQLNRKEFIEDIHEIRKSYFDIIQAYCETNGRPTEEVLKSWKADYQNKLNQLTADHFAISQDYLKRFTETAENGQFIQIDTEKRGRLIQGIKEELELKKAAFYDWELPTTLIRVNVQREEQKKELQDEQLMYDYVADLISGVDPTSLATRQHDLLETIAYLTQLQTQWQENKTALAQYYQKSLAGICEQLNTEALTIYLSRFEKKFHPILLNQELAMTQGQLPLMLCVNRATPNTKEEEQKQMAFATFLLQQGAFINAKDAEGYSALHYAAARGNHMMIRFLLAQSQMIVDLPGPFARTPLHMATFSNECDVEGVELLLAAGAQPNAKTQGEKPTELAVTPLHNAVLRGNKEIIQKLIAYGASPYISDAQGYGILAKAILRGPHNFHMVAFLLSIHVGVSSLIPWSEQDLLQLLKLGKTAYRKDGNAFTRFIALLKSYCEQEAHKATLTQGAQSALAVQWHARANAVEVLLQQNKNRSPQMQSYDDYLNAISAREDHLTEKMTRAQSEQILIKELVFNISQEKGRSGFIEEIYALRISFLKAFPGAAGEVLSNPVIEEKKIEYQKQLEQLKKTFLQKRKEYLAQFKYLVENGQKIEINDTISQEILTQAERVLTQIVARYGDWELPYDKEAATHLINTKFTRALAQNIQAQECVSNHQSAEQISPTQTEDLKERITYLKGAWKNNKDALVQYYQQSLAGICERCDVEALTNYLSRFDEDFHPALVKQPLAMTNGQLPLTHCIGQSVPNTAEQQQNQIAFVTLLLQKGAQLNAINEEGYAALHCAAACGNEILIAHLLAQPGINVNRAGCFARTPLHTATFSGLCKLEGITLLLTAGANPNAKTHGEKPVLLCVTPLHNAVFRGDQTIVEKLLNEGASPYILNAQHSGALAYAVIQGPQHLPIVKYLLSKNIGVYTAMPGSTNDLNILLGLATESYSKAPDALSQLTNLLQTHFPQVNLIKQVTVSLQPEIKPSFIEKMINVFNDSAPPFNATTLVTQIIAFIRTQSLWNQLQAIQDLVNVFQSENVIKERVNSLKQALQGNKKSGWKAALFSPQLDKQHDVSFTPKSFSMDAKNAVMQSPQRFTWFYAHQQQTFNPAQDGLVMVGSTFTTNKNVLKDRSNMHVLDAAFTAYTYNTAGEKEGLILALGDGCGGHFGDEKQDERIARLAHFAVKHSARILAALSSPEQFLAQMQSIVTAIALEVKRKEKIPGENTTLLCCRAYPVEEGYRIVGFNIGDGLLAAFNPIEKSIQTLSPAFASEYGVANFPQDYKPFEVKKIDAIINKNCILFGLSDGVIDGLPTIVTEEMIADVAYRSTALDPDKIATLFNNSNRQENSAAQYLAEVLLKTTIDQVETLRQEKIKNPQELFQEGDDVTIVAMPLAGLVRPAIRPSMLAK